MSKIINIFVIAPTEISLIDTFYRNAHKFRYDGYSILIHDVAPVIEIIEQASDDFQFRVLIHLEFQGKQSKKIDQAAGYIEMKPLRQAFEKGEFVFFTREQEIFPHKGTKEGECIEHHGIKIFYGPEMTSENFFKNIPINIKGHLKSEEVKKVKVKPVEIIIELPDKQSKQHYDIAILCVVPKELDALALIFGFDKTKPFTSIHGLRLWKATKKQIAAPKNKLNIIFAMIGNAGNLPSYLETNCLIQHFDIGLMVLCGIAAGNSKETSIYSVALGKMIIYYENQKLKENNEIVYRLNPLPVEEVRSKDLIHIQNDLANWKNQFKKDLSLISIRKSDFKDKSWITPDWLSKVKIDVGNILSGEKLLADEETISNLVDQVSIQKQTIAGEMEGYGFGYACRQNQHMNWLVFRGISDFGGPEKSDEINDKYQIIAALSAASLLKYYLLNIYR